MSEIATEKSWQRLLRSTPYTSLLEARINVLDPVYSGMLLLKAAAGDSKFGGTFPWEISSLDPQLFTE